MDDRRLSTGDFLSMGLLAKKAPPSLCPEDAKLMSVLDHEDIGETALRSGLQEIGGLYAAQYHGAWKVWKTEKGFSGELYQYRERTEEFADVDIDQALERACTWLSRCSG